MKLFFSHLSIRIFLLLCFMWLFAGNISAQTLDQNQPVWNGGTSERNLPGYYEWQSFKAGITGSLCRIDLMFCNTNVKVNGTGTLKVYSGQGTTGTLLLTQSVTVNGTAYSFNQPFWQTWNLSSTPAIVANSTYTFQFIPTQGGGLTDPYLIQINIPSVYPNGQNYNLGTMGDCAFRTYVIGILPVELISFKGDVTDNDITLKWTTASEINNDYFAIEKSSDGKAFSQIGSVKGMGNSSAVNDYSFIDSHPRIGISYYRLKQVDFNGDFNYSQIIPLKSSDITSMHWIVSQYENTITYTFPKPDDGTITVSDLSGRIVQHKEFSNWVTITLNRADFPASLYIVHIHSLFADNTFKLLQY